MKRVQTPLHLNFNNLIQIVEERQKNILIAVAIIAITALLIYLLPLSGYLKQPKTTDIGFEPSFILVFLLFNLIWIGIPAWIHWAYIKDYSRIKNLWFFALWGGVTGALLGEVAVGGLQNWPLIASYTILMLAYGYLYKKFPWWQVALTSYLGGIIVENIINRAPIQATTLVWIGFFVAPYFVAKIFENRQKIPLKKIFIELRLTIIFSVVLAALMAYISRNNISPPLIIMGFALPFLVTIVVRAIKQIRK